MLNDNGNKTAKKISRSNNQKNNNACAAHFYVHFFAIVLHLPSKRTGAWNAKFHPGLHEGVDVHTDAWTIYQ